MLLGYAHIEEPIWESFSKLSQTSPIFHGRGDGYNSFILPGQLHQGRTEYLAEGHRLVRLERCGWTYTVKLAGILLRWSVTLAFLGMHVDEDRAASGDSVPDSFAQLRNIVAVERPGVSKTQFFKKLARKQAF